MFNMFRYVNMDPSLKTVDPPPHPQRKKTFFYDDDNDNSNGINQLW